MTEYKKITTTYEVWKAICVSHPELRVFSSYSAPDGDLHGDFDKCEMMTEYGFDGCDYPIVGAKTTWDKDSEKPYKRINEKHFYWLCIGVKQND